MKKRITSLFLVLCMLLSMTMTVSFAIEDTETVTYPQACTHTSHAETDGTEWKPLYKTMTEDLAKRQETTPTDQYYCVTDGKYYVEQDFTVTARIYLFGDVTICLNGKTITGNIGDTMGVFNLFDPASSISSESFAYSGTSTITTLTLCDHDPAKAGKLIGQATTSYPNGIRTSSSRTIINMTAGTISGFRGAGINLAGGGTLNLEGGTITANGSVGSSSTAAAASSGVYMAKGTFNFSGGSITGNNGYRYGAGVYMLDGTFNMTGGSIDNNTLSYVGVSYGTGVYVQKGTFNLKGGTISENHPKADVTGVDARGTVYLSDSGSAKFNMTGGTICDNESNYAAAIMPRAGSEVNLSGGIITGNNATMQGGAMYIYETAAVTISDGAAIYGNTASSGPNLYAFNATDAEGSTLNITGGQIGVATDSTGIQFAKGSSQTTTPGAFISGNAKIVGSTAGLDGVASNIYINNLTEGAIITTDNIAATTDDTVSAVSNYVYRHSSYSTTAPSGYMSKKDFTAPVSYKLGGDVELVDKVSLTAAGEYEIDLNGYDLSGAVTPYFSVADGVTLTIKDSSVGAEGRIVGFKDDPSYEGLVLITSGGQFDLYNATLTGRSSTIYNAGGVRVNDGGTFNMYSGTITDNFVPGSGGGVLVNAGGVFNMYGGLITNNRSNSTGSGVWNNGIMTMYGGTIEDNYTSHSNGGQVFLQRSTAQVEEQTVAGELNVSGTAVIGAVTVNTVNTFLNIANLEDGAEIFSAMEADSVDNTVKTETVTDGYRYTYQAEVICQHPELVHVPANGATCTEAGNIEYWTCTCGKYFSDAEAETEITLADTVINAGHTYGELIPAQIEVHTQTELKGAVAAHFFCDVCDTYFDAEKVETTLEDLTAEAPVHTPDIPAPTEEQAQLCTGCGLVMAPKLDHTHNLTHVPANGATCTEAGNIEYWTCTCGKWYSDAEGNSEITDKESVVVPATGEHTEVVVPGKAATETETGLTDGTKCDVCGTPIKAQIVLPVITKDEKMDVKFYKENNLAPELEGYVFAGWYADAEYDEAHTAADGEAYAKLIPAAVLSVKYQLSNDAATSGKASLRLVSTVDCLNYREVGFKIAVDGGEYVKYASNTVFSKIVANADGVQFNETPSVFDPVSSYFITFTITGIPSESYDTEIKVIPYWVTLDGTEYDGVASDMTINRAIAMNS